MLARVLMVAVLVIGVCGCSDSGSDGPAVITFTKVDLPAGSVPVVLASSQVRELYIGVRREGRGPGVLRRGEDGALTEIPVRATGPDGQLARWYSLDSYGEHIVGLGAAGDGKASVWTGTVGGIDEKPQEFDGGSAGDLVGAVETREHVSALVRTDVAVWTDEGGAWTRHPATGAPPESDQGVAVAATKNAAARVLVAGWQRSGAGTIPVVWHVNTEPMVWTTQRLPDAGRTGTALAAMCWLTDLCAAVGQVDGTLAVWHLNDRVWTRETGVPPLPVGERDRLAAPIETNDFLIQAVSDGGEVKLAVENRDTWTIHRTDGPTGTVTAAIKVNDTIYLLAGPDENSQTLWQTNGDPLHWRSIRDQP